MDHLLETFTIFGHIDRFRAGADNLNASGFQCQCQLERGLAAVLNDHTIRLLHINNRQHILERDRLEVEAIGGVIVGRDGLWIAIDHNGFVTIFPHRQRRMDTAIIELDALADAVRATANNHNLVAIGWLRFALLLIGGVHIGSIGGKLSSAGINPLEHRT